MHSTAGEDYEGDGMELVMMMMMEEGQRGLKKAKLTR